MSYQSDHKCDKICKKNLQARGDLASLWRCVNDEDAL